MIYCLILVGVAGVVVVGVVGVVVVGCWCVYNSLCVVSIQFTRVEWQISASFIVLVYTLVLPRVVVPRVV